MRPSSSTSDPGPGRQGRDTEPRGADSPGPAAPRDGTLFGGVYATPAALEATGDRAWVTAMLAVEEALALAAADVGLVPSGPAEAVAAACRTGARAPERLVAALAAGAGEQATPVIALVAWLRGQVPADAARAVHPAATSQDVLDTAAMLIARDALGPALDDAATVAELLAGLAARYRDTPQVGRSMLQHGEPTTFGAACAARLVGVDEARAELARTRGCDLAVQLGGAVGTLRPAGELGPALLGALAGRLGLAEPTVPWHTSRGRVARLAGAIGVLAGELAGAAQDVVLLSATEIGEVSVATPGGSSAMPHKRNPAAAVLAVACAQRIPGLVGTVLAGMAQELQRSAGRWQAEWGTLTELLRLLAGTAAHTRHALHGLHLHEDRMSEHVADLLAATGAPPGPVDTGSAAAFVDRALAAHARRASPSPAPSPPSASAPPSPSASPSEGCS